MDYAHLATDSEEKFNQGATTFLKGLINATVDQKGSCLIGLSGGSTPGPIYEALGKEDIDWRKVWVCLVDERYIVADDDKSNTKLVRDTLLANASIPEEQLLLPDTSLPLEKCVLQYGLAFKEIHPDVVTLGMGPDGHIASLFPPVSEAAFGKAPIIHTQTDQFDVSDRISMTMPLINRAHSKVFLLKGGSKKQVWEDMMASTEGKERWPAKAILRSGGVTLITD